MAEVFEWLSTAEAAEMLEVTVQRVYELIDQGHLAGYRFGRVIRLRREDVDRYRGDDGEFVESNTWVGLVGPDPRHAAREAADLSPEVQIP